MVRQIAVWSVHETLITTPPPPVVFLQFVPFRDYLGHNHGNSRLSQDRLAQEVLAEVPDQIVFFMKKRGFKPKEPPPPSYEEGGAPSAPPQL